MESMFKYIFALIAGAMMLIFFVGFAWKYIGVSQGMQSTELIANFDDYLMLMSGSDDLQSSYPFSQQSAISFVSGKISSGGESRDTLRIVYAPKQLKGKGATIWTKRWSFPYEVENFFYMTNEKYKIVLVFDDDTEEFVQEIFTDMKKTYKNMDEPQNKDAIKSGSSFETLKKTYAPYTNVRFVVFSTGSTSQLETAVTSMKNADIAVIAKADDAEEWDEYGSVTFIKGIEKSDEAPYLGLGMIYGAMFAGDYENYMFNFKRAMARLADITDIYNTKTSDYLVPVRGSTEYSMIQTMLGQMEEKAKEASGKEAISTETIKTIANLAKSLKQANRDPTVSVF